MLKLNNPGNIRVSAETFRGEVRPSAHPSFKQFKTMAWGYRALFVVLRTYIRQHHLQTIESIISRWAPPSENDTEAYVRQVARLTGFDRQRSLTFCYNDMLPLASAISRVENGTPANPADLEEGWSLL